MVNFLQSMNILAYLAVGAQPEISSRGRGEGHLAGGGLGEENKSLTEDSVTSERSVQGDDLEQSELYDNQEQSELFDNQE
ncbi:hypothetical protein J6590_028850 [Homalodisca vitripennis]|nr:hypothetical protein J6590_028850 [Homalodisca vitripennis]